MDGNSSRRGSGIERAIAEAGTQTALAMLVQTHSGQPVEQSYIARWKAIGYVPRWFVDHVAAVTSIPADDLRKPAKAKPNGKNT